MLRSNIAIRPATPRDATHLVAFVDMAGEGLPSHFWREAAEIGQGPFEIGRSRALRNSGAFSWRNAWIAEVDGLVAGGLIGYLIEDPVDLSGVAAMTPLARELTLLEAEVPGHWYVNVLATYPEFRRQGVGRALLDYSEVVGMAASTRGMALIVASENERAVLLYEGLGYSEKARRPLIAFAGFKRGGDWVLMTKDHAVAAGRR